MPSKEHKMLAIVLIATLLITSMPLGIGSFSDQHNNLPAAFAEQVDVYRGDVYQDSAYLNGTHHWSSQPEWIASGSSDSEGRPIFVPYTLQETGNQIIYNSGSASFRFDKTTCQLDLQSQNNAKTIVKNANVDVVEDTEGKFDKATQLESKNCSYELKQNAKNIQFFVRQGDVSTGIKEIEYKTSVENGLEAFMRFNNTNASNENKEFGFQEQMLADSVMFKGAQYTSDSVKTPIDIQKSDLVTTVGSKTFDEIFTLITGSEKIFYSIKDSEHGTTDHVTLEQAPDGKQVKLTTFYTNSNNPLSKNEVLEIDPSYSSNNPTEDGMMNSASQSGTSCSTSAATRYSTAGTADVYKAESTASGSCQWGYAEWDISSISDSATISDTDVTIDIQAVSSGVNGDIVELSVRPSTASNQALMDDIRTASTEYINNNSAFSTTGDNKAFDLGSGGDSKISSQLSSDYFAVGFRLDSYTRDGNWHAFNINAEEGSSPTPAPTLSITYTVACTPNAPTSVAASAQTSTSANISWTNSSNCTNGAVEVQRSPDQSNWTTIYSGAVKSLHTDSGLSSNVQYYYRVRDQSDSDGQSIWGSYSSTVNTTLAPTVPTGLTQSSQTTSGFRTTWSVTGNATTGFKIERETPTGGGFSTIVANTGNSTVHYDHSSLNPGTQYNVRISTINANGTSSASTAVSTYTITNAPTNLVLTPISTTQIDAAWTAPSGTVNGYKIEQKIDAGAWTTRVANTTTTATTYSATGLLVGKQYSFRVYALNQGGTSAASNEATTYAWQTITLNAYENDGTTTFTGQVLQSNSTATNIPFTLSSGTVSINGLAQLQNFTVKETTDNFSIFKKYNFNASATASDSYNTRIFRVDCPSNGAGNDLKLKVNETNGHRISSFSTPVCDSTDDITWTVTFTKNGNSPANYSSSMIATILNTQSYGQNADSFLVNGSSVVTTYDTNKIVSNNFNIGTGMTSVTKSFKLFLSPMFNNQTIGAEGYFKTGRWYSSNTYSAIAPTTQETTANALRAFPFIVGKSVTADRIQFEVTEAISSTNCNVGIYRSNAALYPTTLVVDGGQQSTASTGLKTTTINSTLTSNKLYWLAYSCNGAPTLAAIPPAGLPSVLGYSGSGGLGTQGTGWTVTNTYSSTLPSNYPVNGTILSNANGILIQLRIK